MDDPGDRERRSIRQDRFHRPARGCLPGLHEVVRKCQRRDPGEGDRVEHHQLCLTSTGDGPGDLHGARRDFAVDEREQDPALPMPGGRLRNLFVCSTTSADRERFARRPLGVSGVVNVREVMTGRGDLHVLAIGTDTDDIARIARDIEALGVDIEDEDLVHRDHFGPYHPFGPSEGDRPAPVTSVADLPGDADVVEIRVSADAPVGGRHSGRPARPDGSGTTCW